jgi:Fur family transcriptional regulator, ferric uptake regulator
MSVRARERSAEQHETAALAAWAEHASTVLARAGRRGGRARHAVIGLLAGQECCLTATEIFVALRSEGRPVGLASVYRALERLSELRLVQRLEFGDAARYEPLLPSGEHHHHVLCGACGKVEPFADRHLETALGRLRRARGYDVAAHDVLLRGSCAECRV